MSANEALQDCVCSLPPHNLNRPKQPATGVECDYFAYSHAVAIPGGFNLFETSGLRSRLAAFLAELRYAMSQHRTVPRLAPDPSARNRSLRQLRVLVVDDDEDARDLMGLVLGGAGAKVTLAASASAALDALAEAEFEILVSDIGMPDQDGYDLIRRLRGDASAKLRQIPAVAVTAFGAPEDRRKALIAGFQEHLPKPIDLMELVQVIVGLALPKPI